MDHTIHNFSYVELYMDSTIHISPMLMSLGLAGVRGGSQGSGDVLGGAGNGDGFPTTLPSGQTPAPSRPGTKYPIRGQSLTST